MKEQKIYFYKTLFLGHLIFILCIISLIVLIIKFKSPLKNNYNRAYLDKIEILKETTNKKIVFIGGSNLAFGINSLEIERKFPKYKVINTAVHAGIGLRYMLDDIKVYLKKDDIVIIAPEYDHFYTDGRGDYALWEVLSSKKSLENVSFTVFYRSLPNLLQGITHILFARENKDFNKKFTYDRRGFNKNGDYTEHWQYEPKEKIKPSIIAENSSIKISMVNYLEKFIDDSKSKGIQVSLLPPVFQKSSFEINKRKIEEVESTLITKFDVNPKQFAYSDNLFFDTPYHLNKIGVAIRTEQIIFYLKNKKI